MTESPLQRRKVILVPAVLVVGGAGLTLYQVARDGDTGLLTLAVALAVTAVVVAVLLAQRGRQVAGVATTGAWAAPYSLETGIAKELGLARKRVLGGVPAPGVLAIDDAAITWHPRSRRLRPLQLPAANVAGVVLGHGTSGARSLLALEVHLRPPIPTLGGRAMPILQFVSERGDDKTLAALRASPLAKAIPELRQP